MHETPQQTITSMAYGFRFLDLAHDIGKWQYIQFALEEQLPARSENLPQIRVAVAQMLQASIRHIRPCPLKQNQEAVAEPDQV
jgi:hypothetical protein